MTDAQILDRILRYEGGFVDHPADRGSATNRGITLATLASWRRRPVSVEELRDLTIEETRDIYAQRYLAPWAWVPDGRLRAQLVDWYVTSSPKAVISGLQRAVRAGVDGILGPETKRLTLGAITRGENLSHELMRQRVEYYLSLALDEPRLQVLMRGGPPLQIAFLRGWLRRAVDAAA
jgi:lysozyme family protein